MYDDNDAENKVILKAAKEEYDRLCHGETMTEARAKTCQNLKDIIEEDERI